MAKLAFFGNTNCMPFRYALHLKKMGHEVSFYVDSSPEATLHRPESLFSEIRTPYPAWIIDLGWKPKGRDYFFPRHKLRSLIAEINSDEWDGIVLCGEWLKLANYLSHPRAVIALLAGSDLDVMASYRQVIVSRYSHNPFVGVAIKISQMLGAYLQRRGIRKSTLVNYFPEGINPIGDLLLNKIMRGSRFERLQNRGLSVENTPYKEPSRRTGASVVVFSPTRFIWKSPLPPGYTEQENKGNDIMLRGLERFYKATHLPIQVHLVEKGIHVAEAKRLALELGISHLITWHKEMTLYEILNWYSESDIILDQFGNHWLGAGAVDSMLMGRPVIGKARNEVFSKVLGEPMPMCDASDPNEVSIWLEALVNDSGLRKEIGIKSRDYMLRHFDAKDTAASIIEHVDRVRRTATLPQPK